MKPIFEKLLQEIPEFDTFLSLDELDESSRKLAAEYPDVVELFPFGKSRSGHELLCLKIGSGSRSALMFCLPHPNEPIGTAMVEYFSRRLAEDEELRRELDYTWYFVKAWDCDGYELNRGWIKGPYTITNYSRNFFRPASRQQVDWTFPIDYKELHFHNVMPEADAMMHLIDLVKPSFIYSLHNSGFGGVYWYFTYDIDHGVYEQLHKVPGKHDIPVHLGEPESPALKVYYPAVFEGGGIAVEYDYLEKHGVPGKEIPAIINSGTCSDEYASLRYDSMTMLTEMPYFYDARIADLSPSDMTRRAAVVQKCQWELASNQRLRDMLSPTQAAMHEENPFLMAIQDFTKDGGVQTEMRAAQEDPAYDVTATVAEKFDNLDLSRFYRLLSYGMLVRSYEWELAQSDVSDEHCALFAQALEDAKAVHAALAAELEQELHYSVIPIRKLVAIQLECGLRVMTADYSRQ